MNFYDDASWLLVPSGIEEDIVFAQKPTSGLGDLSFSRASDATYTDSTGVVRRSPYNLFTQSVWTGGGLNVAPTGWSQGQTSGNFEPQTAINGSVPYRFYGTVARRYITQTVTLNAGQDFIVSVFVNSVTTGTTILNVISTTASVSNLKYYVNNVEVISSTPITANTTIAMSFTATVSASGSIRIGGGVGGGTTYDFVISQPQASEGTEALDYFPTTNRQDVPRIDFRNADGTLSSCGRLLLEPQRTNSIRNSSMVGAVAGSPGTLPTNWTVSNAGLTQTIVGVGTELGLPYVDIRLNGTASGEIFNLFTEGPAQVVASNGQTWTNALYMKTVAAPNPYNSILNNFSERTAAGALLTGAQQAMTLTSTLTRFSFTRTNTNAATERINAGYQGTLTIGAAYDFTIRIAAPQMELGSYATTWVPTTTAAVTRIADTANKNDVSSLIGQTEGTIFLDMRYEVAQTARFSLSDGTGNNWIFVSYPESTTAARVFINASGIIQINNTINSVFTANQNYKIAFAYKSGNWALYINGASISSGTQTFAFSGTLSRITVTSTFAPNPTEIFGKINQTALFPTRLTNAQLAQLTTL